MRVYEESIKKKLMCILCVDSFLKFLGINCIDLELRCRPSRRRGRVYESVKF